MLNTTETRFQIASSRRKSQAFAAEEKTYQILKEEEIRYIKLEIKNSRQNLNNEK